MDIDVISQVLGTAVVVVSGAFVLAAIRLTAVRRGVLLAATAGYVMHIVLSWTIWIEYPGFVSDDAHVYDNIAIALARWWSGAAISSPVVAVGKEGVVFLLAILYWLLGYIPLAGLAINALMFAGAMLLVGDAADRLAGPRAAIAASLLMLVHPSMLVWGSQLLREPAAWLCIAALANIGARIVVGGLTWLRACTMLSVGVFFVPIRSILAVFVLAAFAVALVLLGSDGRLGVSTRVRSFVMFLVGMATVAALAPRYGGLDIGSRLDPSALAVNHNALLRTATTGFGETVQPSYSSLLSQLPASLTIILFGPFPWQLPGAAATALVDTAAWWCTCALAVFGWRRNAGRLRWLPLIVSIILVLVLAGTLANIGIILRMRAQVVVLLVPLAAVGLVRLFDTFTLAGRDRECTPTGRRAAGRATTAAMVGADGLRRQGVPITLG